MSTALKSVFFPWCHQYNCIELSLVELEGFAMTNIKNAPARESFAKALWNEMMNVD